MEPSEVLKKCRTIAVIGCSSNPEKDAHTVPAYMQSHGYRIIPINPTATEILGEKAYKTLADVPDKIDMVNVFRPSEEVAGIVEQALRRKDVRVIWTQLGIRDDVAAEKAREAGKIMIQDRCLRVEHRMMGK